MKSLMSNSVVGDCTLYGMASQVTGCARKKTGLRFDSDRHSSIRMTYLVSEVPLGAGAPGNGKTLKTFLA